MKYIVIKIQGHQYKVSEGETFLVDKISSEKPEADVLLLVDGEKVKVGKPVLKEVKVSFKVLGDEMGEKLYVRKYKAKSRYHKKIGFRPKYTKLLVQKIS